jgi:hypothetical protein
VGDKLHLLPTRHAGVQPQLLADAVQREQEATVETLGHTTLATARLRFLFLAARIWRHAGRVGISYSDHYAEQSVFDRLMMRLRSVAAKANGFLPVIPVALRC